MPTGFGSAPDIVPPPPRSETFVQSPCPSQVECTVCTLIKVLVDREQASTDCRACLQARIEQQEIEVQQGRDRCMELIGILSTADRARIQLEKSLAQAVESERSLTRDLQLQQSLVTEAKLQCISLHSINEMLLDLLSDGACLSPSASPQSFSFQDLFLENRKHQQTISDLESTIHHHEETIERLRATLQDVSEASHPYQPENDTTTDIEDEEDDAIRNEVMATHEMA